jgi:hypothetical protein
MRSSTPTGTIPETAEGVLAVLNATVDTEPFSREVATEALSADEYPDSVDTETAEMVHQLASFEYDDYLEMLLKNGYLYGVDDGLRITPTEL